MINKTIEPKAVDEIIKERRNQQYKKKSNNQKDDNSLLFDEYLKLFYSITGKNSNDFKQILPAARRNFNKISKKGYKLEIFEKVIKNVSRIHPELLTPEYCCRLHVILNHKSEQKESRSEEEKFILQNSDSVW